MDIKVPVLGESVSEATVAKWFKRPGDAVSADESLVELETDKVTVEVPALAAGRLESIAVAEGETVEVGALLGILAEGEEGSTAAPEASAAAPVLEAEKPASPVSEKKDDAASVLSPAVGKLIAESGLDPASITGTGKGGRILKGDVLAAQARAARTAAAPAVSVAPAVPAAPAAPRAASAPEDAAREERVRMTRLRRTIARRLKEAQQTAAMLTTFNEVDMGPIMELRGRYKETFEKKHGIKLGFMSFFVRACVAALKDIPNVNAEIDGEDIIYKNYVHMGVAVGTDRGLVVPVVRDADQMDFAEIEKAIAALGKKAREGKLGMEDMVGGTFTISNGGVYGSLMSTPILNAPQSGILGMHKIQQRPMAIDGQVVIRPMMYLALSYDHRMVDGKEAVTFLVRVKECLEDPQRLMLDL
jgi:2-oxoglutarate dehydrogenase E2 component (dihydrolipoamide succinyltransferase)